MAVGIDTTLTVKDDGSATIQRVAGELKKLERAATGGASSITAGWQKMKGAWVEITASVLALKAAMDLAREAAGFAEDIGRLDHQLAEFNMSGGEMIRILKDITHGQLSMADAARVASKGLAEGLNPDQLSTFVQLGGEVAKVMHTDIPSATETMLSSILSGRTRLLNQVGIFVDLEKVIKQYAIATNQSVEDITESEKAHIRLNAVLAQAPDALKRLSDGTETAADKMRKMKATTDDLKLSAGELTRAVSTGLLGILQFGAAAATALIALNPLALAIITIKDGISGLREYLAAAKGSISDLVDKGVSTFTAAIEQAKKAADPLSESVKRVGDVHETVKPKVVNLKNVLEQEKLALEQLKLAVPGSVEWLKKLEEQSKALADKQKELIGQQIALREQSALSLRELTKPLAQGKVDLFFPTDQDTSPDLRLLKMRQQFDALGDQEREAIEKMKADIAPQLASLPAAVQAQMLAQSGKAIHDAFTKDREGLLGPMRDLMGQLFAPATVEQALGDFQAQILKGNLDFLKQEQDLISQQQIQVKAAIDTFTQIVDAAAGNMQKIADKMVTQMKGATMDVRKSFQEALNGIARDTQALYKAISGAQATIPLVLQQPAGASSNGPDFIESAGPMGEEGFASGGSFMVGGSGGVDRTPVRFMATRGEQVTVTPPGPGAGARGGGAITINVYPMKADPRAVAKEVRQELIRLGRFA